MNTNETSGQLSSNMNFALQFAEKYGTQKENKKPKAVKLMTDSKLARIEHGRLYMQPTGGNKLQRVKQDNGTFVQELVDGKALNYSYCYFGIRDSQGNHMSGFSMDNKAMLELVDAEVFTPQFLELFEKYATKYASDHKVMMI